MLKRLASPLFIGYFGSGLIARFLFKPEEYWGFITGVDGGDRLLAFVFGCPYLFGCVVYDLMLPHAQRGALLISDALSTVIGAFVPSIFRGWLGRLLVGGLLIVIIGVVMKMWGAGFIKFLRRKQRERKVRVVVGTVVNGDSTGQAVTTTQQMPVRFEKVPLKATGSVIGNVLTRMEANSRTQTEREIQKAVEANTGLIEAALKNKILRDTVDDKLETAKARATTDRLKAQTERKEAQDDHTAAMQGTRGNRLVDKYYKERDIDREIDINEKFHGPFKMKRQLKEDVKREQERIKKELPPEEQLEALRDLDRSYKQALRDLHLPVDFE